MADQTMATQRWLFGTTFAVLFIVLMLIHLVPLSIAAGRVPGPDLLVALTMAWVLRRPDFVPTPVVAVLFLMADMLFMRPIGLWTALIVLAVEFLRVREHSTREQTFLAEWAMVSGVLLTITLVDRIVLTVLFVEQVSFGLVLFQFLATALSYPLVVLGSRWVFGINKLTSSQADARGRNR